MVPGLQEERCEHQQYILSRVCFLMHMHIIRSGHRQVPPWARLRRSLHIPGSCEGIANLAASVAPLRAHAHCCLRQQWLHDDCHADGSLLTNPVMLPQWDCSVSCEVKLKATTGSGIAGTCIDDEGAGLGFFADRSVTS